MWTEFPLICNVTAPPASGIKETATIYMHHCLGAPHISHPNSQGNQLQNCKTKENMDRERKETEMEKRTPPNAPVGCKDS